MILVIALMAVLAGADGPTAIDEAPSPETIWCASTLASGSPVEQFTAFSTSEYRSPTCAIVPASMAVLAVLWQTSRATSLVRRSPGGRPIKCSVLFTFSSERMFKNGDCASCTESACFSVSSNAVSPVLFEKSAITIASFSVNFGAR